MKALSTTKVMMFILCAVSVFAGTAQADTLFSDGFESGDFTTGGWSEKGSPYTQVRTDSAYTGTYGARLAISGWIIKTQSTVGYSTIHVKYARKTSGLTSPESLYVEWSTDGTTWNTLEQVQGVKSWASKDITCGTGADNNAGFRVRFRVAGNQTTDLAYIDDVEITGTPPLPVPGKATSPSPEDTAINVGITTDLGWTAGSDATSHIVYFGTSSPGTLQGEQSGTTFDTGTMSNNTTYYWRIDEKNDSGTTTGDVWSFTTKAQVPDVVNMTQTAASSAITDAGLVVGTVTQECSNTIAAGDVISQDPTGGTQVDAGSSVNLVVSSGQPTVPDVTGQTEAAAITAINAVANISYGTSSTECSDAVAAGNVISQSATGTVSCGTVVNLVVSSGQPIVPDVTGQTEAAAITAINAVANISYGTSSNECSDTVAAGNVISQSATGTVSCGTVVNLVVSSGPCLAIISGYIAECDTMPVEGVLVEATNGGGTDSTDADGYYELVVPYGWSGTVTPSTGQDTFQPALRDYVNVTANQLNQNYAAHYIYDLNYDCYIDFGDIAVIGENWLQTGENLPGDFYKDGANTVNFLDFADFANIW